MLSIICQLLYKIHNFEIYGMEISIYTANKQILLSHHVWEMQPIKYMAYGNTELRD